MPRPTEAQTEHRRNLRGRDERRIERGVAVAQGEGVPRARGSRRVTLTRQMTYDRGEDVANRRMRAAGRKAWDRTDHFLACLESARLALQLGGMDEIAARDVLSRSREGKQILRAFDASRRAA